MADSAKKTEWSRQTVNFTPELAQLAEKRWRALGFSSWTDYIKSLVESDLQERPFLIRSEDGAYFATHLTRVKAPAKTGFSTKPKPQPEKEIASGNKDAGERTA